MMYNLIGIGIGLYVVWWIMTVGGRYPLFYGPKWHDKQAELHRKAELAQKKKEKQDREDLAKRIAEEMKK